jgi:glycosyltransferase involved in cell wall biosynthesis
MLNNLCIWRGGAERLVLSLSQELKRLGYDVDVVVLRYDQARCFPELLGETKVTGASRVFQSRVFNVTPPLQALEMALRIPEGYDILHTHNFPTNIAAFLATALRRSYADTPHLWQCNEPPRILYEEDEIRGFYREVQQLEVFARARALLGLRTMHATSKPLDKLAARSASAITTLSRFVAARIRETYGCDARVVNPGVDLRTFHPNIEGDVVRRRFGIGNAPLLLTVSRLWPAKNIGTALMAFRIVVEELPDAMYVIVGEGPSAQTLEGLAFRLGIGHRVKFVCDAEVESLAEFYGACDVFVFPALGEPWGLVALEAMASGKPVVAANDGGLPEMINDKHDGILVRPRDPRSYAQAILCLLNDRSLAEAMGARAAITAKAYTWERMARSYSEIYDQLLQS